MPLRLPSYMGTWQRIGTGRPYGNYGTINNKVLNSPSTQNLKGAFSWNTEFQISFNKNKLVALDGADAVRLRYGRWRRRFHQQRGEPLYNFCGYKVAGVYGTGRPAKLSQTGEYPPTVFNRYGTTGGRPQV